MQPTIDKKKLVSRHYADFSKLAVRKEFNRLSNPSTQFEKDIAGIILEKKPKKVLDVGCGNGDLLAYIRKSGFTGELCGIDLSKGMINEAKKQNKKEKLGITFSVADAQKIPFQNNAFDMIIAKHLLYHLPNPQKGINEMHRCLAPKGTLIITLNSEKDRPRFFEFEKKACQKYSLKSVHGQQLVSLENAKKFLKKFRKTKTITKKGKVNAPELFVKYFDSLRDNFEPEPSDALWQKVIQDVKKHVANEMKNRKKFVETKVTGMIIATK